MALNPENALVAGRGIVLLGAVGATPPTLTALETYVSGGLVTPPASFTTFGDTSPEDLPEFGSDGGDMTMLSTWAFANVAEIPSGDAKSVYYTVNAIEFNKETLALYEGGRAGTPAADLFWAPSQPVPTLSSACVVMIDSRNGQVKGYFSPKVSIRAADAVTLDRENWAQIPLRFTELTHPGATGPHAWLSHGVTA